MQENSPFSSNLVGRRELGKIDTFKERKNEELDKFVERMTIKQKEYKDSLTTEENKNDNKEKIAYLKGITDGIELVLESVRYYRK
ncbi:hypothetical protein [Peribacillus frigoritolerans]|uniref:hypothetical protein n=1 Tax=Peribacillus frigoritolerans TaxID=450367 RepID=UPI002EA69240|nr:hypothetical protein [Peribacillus frigoritolerans]